MDNQQQTIELQQPNAIWHCLSERTPQPYRAIEIEVDCQFWQIVDKTIVTKTFSHNGKLMIKIEGDKGFFRGKFIEEFNQSLRWRYNDI